MADTSTLALVEINETAWKGTSRGSRYYGGSCAHEQGRCRPWSPASETSSGI